MAFSSLLAFACTGDEPTFVTSNDAGIDDAGNIIILPGDGGTVVPGSARCDTGKPFGSPIPFNTGLTGMGDDYSPRMSADELTLYFATTRGSLRTLTRLVRATRTSKTADFGNVTDILPAQAAKGEMNPTVSDDGLLLVFSRSLQNPPATGRTMDFVRAMTPGAFTQIPSVLQATFTQDDGDTYLLPDASAMYFSGINGSFREIIRWKKKDGGPEPFMNDGTVLVGTRHFSSPVVTQDELVMFLGVGATNNTALTTLDIHVSTRPNTTANWGEPIPLASLNASNVMDVPSWLSADRCVLTLTTTRDGESRMYIATRPL